MRLRGGVERGKDDAVWDGVQMCRSYFEHLRASGQPAHRVAARAAETFACLEALSLAKGAAQHKAAAAAVQLCAPYLVAAECIYAADDEHNVRMRAFCRNQCGECGQPARSRCSRCKLVGYCSSDCQKAAWKTHKAVCCASVPTPAK